jgi:hypothetical protein
MSLRKELRSFFGVVLLAAAPLAGCANATEAQTEGCPVDGQGGAAADDRDGTGGGSTIIIDDPDDDCTPTGEELCDGIDNNCDGQIDEGIDFSRVQSCGNCQTDCTRAPNVESPSCSPPENLDGVAAGSCGFESCAIDFWDLDGEVATGCEYYCPYNPGGDIELDDAATGCGLDDDCDGLIDEDVDLCGDAENCGSCGRGCDLEGVHATFACVSTAGAGKACTPQNTACAIEACEAGFFDANGDAGDGCEYQCTPTGEELCDGIDNDCDRLIDNVDADLEEADDIGEVCFGGDEGICAQSAQSGIGKCIGGQVVCCDADSNSIAGTNPALPTLGVRNGVCDVPSSSVVRPGTVTETCNGLDDDCDGSVDDSPSDAGASCGLALGACQPGTMQCTRSGQLVCAGATLPSVEVCNGVDDDCDGIADGTLGVGTPSACLLDDDCPGVMRCLTSALGGSYCATPSGDSIGTCNEPTTPYDSPCRAGRLACNSGVLACVGSVGPQGADVCGEDRDCNGVLANQPNLQTDPQACGSCGTDCTELYPGAAVVCSAGSCVPQSCKAGRIDCGGADSWDCETLCTKTSDTETCNGVDDDCDCVIDDIAPADIPSPTVACGVAGAATDAACTGATVACQGGAFRCQFAPGYCDAGGRFPCAGVLDLCDERDNDCDGNRDEDVSGKGQVCYSDEGAAIPHGACQASALRICDPEDPSGTVCPARKNLTARQNETCDGKDNDCDGQVDEPRDAPGGDASYVVPAVVRVRTSPALYVTAYEMSRASGTATSPGTGNGYWVEGLTPSGTPTEESQACSVAGRVPWFNVTPAEAAQSCGELGGRLCTVSDWQTACWAGTSCEYGYGTSTSCQLPGSYPTGTPSCNVSERWGTSSPDLLSTGNGALAACYANFGTGARVYDITGNVREIVWDEVESAVGCIPEAPEDTGCVFRAMGGTYQSLEAAGRCDDTFVAVESGFKLYNAGFRCCFDSDPR